MPPGTDNRELARISEQLEELKRLTILMLLASGVQSAHVARALGVHQSVLSRMLPVREIQRAAAKRSRAGESDG
jgi:IS30 family transposase